MKILYLINNLSNGGAEKLLSDLLPSLKSEFDIEVLLLNNENNTEKYITILRNSDIKVSFLSQKQVGFIGLICRLFTYVKGSKFDLIHVNLFPAFYCAIITKILLKNIKLIYTEHTTTNRRSETVYGRLLDQIVYLFYDKIIAISNDVRSSLILRRVNSKRIIVIENGIDLLKFNPFCIKEKKLRKIGMAGRLCHPKDQATIIRSLRQLPENIQLLLAGTGTDSTKLVKLATDLGVIKRIFFLGIVTNIREYYESIDIHICSSKFEGFGLSAVESMAVGIPTIASDVPGLREVVSGGGQLFQYGDDKKLSSLILELYEKDEIYKQYSQMGIKKAQEYDITNMSNRYKSLYQNIINNTLCAE